MSFNDFDKYKIQALGSFGGFSHRYIASLVLGKSLHRVTRRDISRIKRQLYTNHTLVTNWRNGKSPEAAKFVQNAIRGRRKAQLA